MLRAYCKRQPQLLLFFLNRWRLQQQPPVCDVVYRVHGPTTLRRAFWLLFFLSFRVCSSILNAVSLLSSYSRGIDQRKERKRKRDLGATSKMINDCILSSESLFYSLWLSTTHNNTIFCCCVCAAIYPIFSSVLFLSPSTHCCI